MTSRALDILVVNSGNVVPAVLATLLLPFYVSTMGDRYAELSFGLLLVSTFVVFESGFSRVIAMRLQRLDVAASWSLEANRELSLGIVISGLLTLVFSILILLSLPLQEVISALDITWITVYLFSVCLASLLRAVCEVRGDYSHYSAARILNAVALNSLVLVLIFDAEITTKEILLSGCFAKICELLFLVLGRTYSFYFQNPSFEAVKGIAPNLTHNFFSNFLSSSFSLIDKSVVLETIPSKTAANYSALQDANMKYGVFLSSFHTLFLKRAGSSEEKKKLITVVTVSHIIFVIAALVSLVYFFNSFFNRESLILFLIFSTGIFFNALGGLELIVLQRKSEFRLIFNVQLIEFLCFSAAVWLVVDLNSVLLLSLVWSGRMMCDFFVLKIANKLT